MPDTIAGSAATTSTLAIGGSITSALDIVADHDWFRVSLIAGTTYAIRTASADGREVDTTIAIRDASGTQLAFNDDVSSTSVFSSIRFTPTTSGTYYVDVGGYDDAETGAYTLSLNVAGALPVYTNDQIATAIMGSQKHFNVRPGGTLTVNLTGLTSPGVTLAREALAVWSDISGIRFNEVSTGGQIVFDTSGDGASTSKVTSGNFITKATVSITTGWIADYGTATNSYSFQTFLHEIGHALGLSHPAGYNGSADYATDATFANDSWATTVMSYFDERENSYFSALGFTREYDVTPTAADALAIQNLYGARTGLRTGDTIYGVGNTTGRIEYDIANATAAFTIFDDGGIDTLNYSSFSQNQLINLNAETFSNIGGKVGNMSIGRGVVIENAIGGSGADILIGNDAPNVLMGGMGADTLTGGGGADIFAGSLAELNGDHITDLSIGDRIRISDASYTSLSFIETGSSLSFGGATMDIGSLNARLVIAAASSGADLIATTRMSGLTDFNGDGHSDILWRSESGAVSTWGVTGNARGGTVQQGLFNTSVSTEWRIVETGDFNGDGHSDILWRNINGQLSIWNGGSNGQIATSGSVWNALTTSSIAAVGDFDGDGRDDVLWRQSNGEIAIWRGSDSGLTTGGYTHAAVPTGWKVEGVADFNGDGRTDIMWRNDNGALSIWTSTGSTFTEASYANNGPGLAWHVDGLGDFNGDGRADILWRNDDGRVSIWTSTGTGFTQGTFNDQVGTGWRIAAVEDLNADGKADIIWQTTDGTTVTTWQSNGSGFDQLVIYATVPAGWTVQGHDFPL